MWQFFLDLLFPKISLDDEPGTWVTPQEWVMLGSEPVRLERSVLLKKGIRHLDGLVAADTYAAAPMLRVAIHRFKFQRIRALAVPLGGLLADASALLRSPDGAPVLCPVPLHWTRRFARGFNQSRLLAEMISARTGWEIAEILHRTRATGYQSHRSHAERRHALAHVFRCAANQEFPDHVVLVDDVSTTGATLDACAAALKEKGVRRVEAIVLALGESRK